MEPKNIFLQKISEQLHQLNKNEHILIIPVEDTAFYVFDIDKHRLLSFVINKEQISDNSENVELWIYDKLTFEYAIFQISLKQYSQTASENQRLVFAEQYIKEFDKKKEKETLIKLLQKNDFSINNEQ